MEKIQPINNEVIHPGDKHLSEETEKKEKKSGAELHTKKDITQELEKIKSIIREDLGIKDPLTPLQEEAIKKAYLDKIRAIGNPAISDEEKHKIAQETAIEKFQSLPKAPLLVNEFDIVDENKEETGVETEAPSEVGESEAVENEEMPDYGMDDIVEEVVSEFSKRGAAKERVQLVLNNYKKNKGKYPPNTEKNRNAIKAILEDFIKQPGD